MFIDNLAVSFNDDKVTVSTEFDVNVTEDFERGDVLEWCEGFNRLTIAFLETNSSVDKDKDYYNLGRDFLRRLSKNQKSDIVKI